MAKLTLDDFKGIVQHIHSIYQYDNYVEEANTSYQVWCNRGFQVNQLGFIDMFNGAVLYPAVCKAICTAMALPVSPCTVERSFSTLRRVKTWLRSTMTEDRLNGLCMMSVHREKIHTSKQQFIERVVTEFGRESRRLQFLFLE